MDLGASLQARLELSESPSLQMEEQQKWDRWVAQEPQIPTGGDLALSGLTSALKTAGGAASFMASAPSDLVMGLAKGGTSQILQTGHDIVRMGENVAQMIAPTPAGALKMRAKAAGTGEGSITAPSGAVQTVAHPIGQFLSLFAPGVRGLKAVGAGPKTAAALSGFAADFAQDPEAGNLADVAGDIYGAFSPDGQAALLDMMKTGKGGGELENRLKNAFLGGATGLTLEGVMAGVKMLRNRGQMNRLGETIRQAYAEAQGERGAIGYPQGTLGQTMVEETGQRGPGMTELVESARREFPMKPRVVEDSVYQGKRMGAVMGPNDNMVVAVGPDGKDLGYLWYTREADGGFSVRKVEVSKEAQKKGVAKLLYEQVSAAEGLYKGSTDRTPEGDALIEALKKSLPGIFPKEK